MKRAPENLLSAGRRGEAPEAASIAPNEQILGALDRTEHPRLQALARRRGRRGGGVRAA
jgi:hypothetical protein